VGTREHCTDEKASRVRSRKKAYKFRVGRASVYP
jgi:hypothetical protein